MIPSQSQRGTETCSTPGGVGRGPHPVPLWPRCWTCALKSRGFRLSLLRGSGSLRAVSGPWRLHQSRLQEWLQVGTVLCPWGGGAGAAVRSCGAGAEVCVDRSECALLCVWLGGVRAEGILAASVRVSVQIKCVFPEAYLHTDMQVWGCRW